MNRIITHIHTLCILPSYEFNLLNGITYVISAGAKGTHVQKKNHPMKGKGINTHIKQNKTKPIE